MANNKFIAHKTAIVALICFLSLPVMQILPSLIRITYVILFFMLFFVTSPKRLIPVLFGEGLIVVVFVFGNAMLSSTNVNIFQNAFIRLWFWIPFLIMLSLNVINDREYSCFLFKLIIVIQLISAISTIIGLLKFPYAARELATGRNDLYSLKRYTSLNIGGYGFIYSLVLTLPILISSIFKISKQKTKIFSIFIILIFYVTIFLSQYTIATLLSIFLGVLSLFERTKNPIGKILGWSIVAFLLIGLMIMFWDSLMQFLSDCNLNFLVNRLNGFMRAIRYGEDYSGLTTRTSLYYLSFKTFLNHPIFGSFLSPGTGRTGGHSFILDTLGRFGMFGVLFIVHIVLVTKKSQRPLRTPQIENTFLLSLSVGIFLLALVNTFDSSNLAVVVFVLSSCAYSLNTKNL